MKRKSKQNILFVTGTDTGVGKTVFTAMLLHNLRSRGLNVLAMKPFCSGDLSDVNLLRELQDEQLTAEEINPYYFPDPVAPISSRIAKRVKIRRADVLRKISAIADRCDLLLIEGCGGVMVPITEKFLLADLVGDLKCPVVLVAANRLGVMNHTLLSVEALVTRGIQSISILLMEQASQDVSTASNARVLKKLVRPHSLHSFPRIDGNLQLPSVLRAKAGSLNRFVTAQKLANIK